MQAVCPIFWLLGSLLAQFEAHFGASLGLLGLSWASLGPPGYRLGVFLALFWGPVCVFLVALAIFIASRGLKKPSEAFFYTILAYLEASGHLVQRFSGFVSK